MEDLVKLILLNLLKQELAIDFSLAEINEDENGLVTIKYQKPKNQKVLKEFKDYLDTISNELFIDATAAFRETNPKEFNILELERTQDLEAFNNAVNNFKKTVSEVAKAHIYELEEQVQQLTAKINYLGRFTNS